MSTFTKQEVNPVTNFNQKKEMQMSNLTNQVSEMTKLNQQQGNNMKTLSQNEINAVSLATEFNAHRTSGVIIAAKCGKELIAVKESLKHGKFNQWVKDNMPVKIRQCQKFMKLYNVKPELISNTQLNALFDIDSELMLLATDDDIETKVRKEAEEGALSQVEIALRIKVEEEKKTGKAPESAKKESKTPKPLSKESYIKKVLGYVAEIKGLCATDSEKPLDADYQAIVDKVSEALTSINEDLSGATKSETTVPNTEQ